jgi:hypothetical protein
MSCAISEDGVKCQGCRQNAKNGQKSYDKNDKGWQNACVAVKITRTLSKLQKITEAGQKLPKVTAPYPGGAGTLFAGEGRGGVTEAYSKF